MKQQLILQGVVALTTYVANILINRKLLVTLNYSQASADRHLLSID